MWNNWITGIGVGVNAALTGAIIYLTRKTVGENKRSADAAEKSAKYANESYMMTKEMMSRQVELQIIPLIAIEHIEDRKSSIFNITNIGNGTALNIEFEPINFGSNDLLELKLIFPSIRSLKAGESKEIQVKSLLSGQESDFSWTAHLNPKYANRVIELNLKYNDVEFKEITQTFELGLGDMKIKLTKQY